MNATPGPKDEKRDSHEHRKAPNRFGGLFFNLAIVLLALFISTNFDAGLSQVKMELPHPARVNASVPTAPQKSSEKATPSEHTLSTVVEMVKNYRQNLAILENATKTLQSQDHSLKELETEIKNKNARIHTLDQKLEEMTASATQTSQVIADLRERTQGQKQELAALEKKYHAQVVKNTSLGKELTQLKTEFASLKTGVSQPKPQLESQPKPESQAKAVKESDHNSNSASNTQRKIASEMLDNFKKRGIDVDADPKSGTITFNLDEAFEFKNNSFDLTPRARAQLRLLIPVYAKSLFGRKDLSERLLSVTITGYASPRYRQEFVDPHSNDRVAYERNLKLSLNRAQQITDYIFGSDIGEYPFKKELQARTSTKGKSYSDPIPIDETTTESCGDYDCKKSRRVQMSFSVSHPLTTVGEKHSPDLEPNTRSLSAGH